MGYDKYDKACICTCELISSSLLAQTITNLIKFRRLFMIVPNIFCENEQMISSLYSNSWSPI